MRAVPLDRQKRGAYIQAHAGGSSTLQTGRVAEWLCSGLQIRVHRFDSGLGLHYLFRAVTHVIRLALGGQNMNNFYEVDTLNALPNRRQFLYELLPAAL